MVTVAELMADRKVQELQKMHEECRRAEKIKEENNKILEQHIHQASTMLNGELGVYLKKLNSEGKNKVILKSYTGLINFNLDPQYEPSKLLLKNLHKAGFDARIVTNYEQNKELIVVDGDYWWEDRPGKHAVHELHIQWCDD